MEPRLLSERLENQVNASAPGGSDGHMSAAAVLTILLELELAGRLRRTPGNQVALLT